MVDYKAARKAMVDGQIRPSDITLYPVLKALLETQREVFVPRDKKSVAYSDQNIDLGNGRTVLAPRTLGRMLESANIQPGDLVLTIGAGLGYESAVIAQLAQAVIAVEEAEGFASTSEEVLSEKGFDNVVVQRGDLTAGAPEHGLYDVIFINGAVEQIPAVIEDQLKDEGRMVAIRVDGKRSQISLGIKSSGRVNWNDAHNAWSPVLPGFQSAKEFVF